MSYGEYLNLVNNALRLHFADTLMETQLKKAKDIIKSAVGNTADTFSLKYKYRQ